MAEKQKEQIVIKPEENRVERFLTEVETAVAKRLQNCRTVAHIVYFLYVLSFFFIITSIVGVILAHIYRGKLPLDEKLLYDHFTWQIRTFWISLALVVVAVVFSPTIIVSILIGAGGTVWYIYRIVKGWVYLFQNKRLYRN